MVSGVVLVLATFGLAGLLSGEADLTKVHDVLDGPRTLEESGSNVSVHRQEFCPAFFDFRDGYRTGKWLVIHGRQPVGSNDELEQLLTGPKHSWVSVSKRSVIDAAGNRMVFREPICTYEYKEHISGKPSNHLAVSRIELALNERFEVNVDVDTPTTGWHEIFISHSVGRHFACVVDRLSCRFEVQDRRAPTAASSGSSNSG